MNTLLPRRKGKGGSNLGASVTDDPKGRLSQALEGILHQMLSAGSDPRAMVMANGLKPLLLQTLSQLTNFQVLELIGNLRKAFDWIEYGPKGHSPEVNGEDAPCGSDGNG